MKRIAAVLLCSVVSAASAQTRTRTILSATLEKNTSVKIEASSDTTVTLNAVGIARAMEIMILSPDSARALASRLDSLLSRPMPHDKGESVRSTAELRDMGFRGTLMASRTVEDSKETLIYTVIGPGGHLAMMLPSRRAAALIVKALDSAATVATQMSIRP